MTTLATTLPAGGLQTGRAARPAAIMPAMADSCSSRRHRSGLARRVPRHLVARPRHRADHERLRDTGGAGAGTLDALKVSLLAQCGGANTWRRRRVVMGQPP